MEMFRNLEVVLMLCFGLICAAALLVQPKPELMQGAGAETGKMPIVIVTGKRLSAAEKAQLAP